MTDVTDLAESYKREVAVPGEFDRIFPNTSPEDIAGAIGDAFGQAQLDGFFGTMEYDPNTGFITPDLSTAGAALVIFYAGARTIKARIRELRSTKYVAGPTEAQQNLAISALVEELKSIEDRRKSFIQNALSSSRAASTYVMDSYPARGLLYGGLFGYEYPGNWC
jgi:hypothetical protein